VIISTPVFGGRPGQQRQSQSQATPVKKTKRQAVSASLGVFVFAFSPRFGCGTKNPTKCLSVFTAFPYRGFSTQHHFQLKRGYIETPRESQFFYTAVKKQIKQVRRWSCSCHRSTSISDHQQFTSCCPPSTRTLQETDLLQSICFLSVLA
jgi:hypothetical protein